MTTATACRPIIMSADSVRSILGKTKTQTRRVARLTSGGHVREPGGRRRWHPDDPEAVHACPYGGPGDHLWVRETWARLLHTLPATGKPMPVTCGDRLIEHATRRADGSWNYDGEVIAYRATSDVGFCDGDGFMGEFANREDMPRWRSPLHMRMDDSRIVLEIAGVRLERLCSISERDARAEGAMDVTAEDDVICRKACRWDQILRAGEEDDRVFRTVSYRAAFAAVWESINAKRGHPWSSNPWVWVVQFRLAEVRT